MPLLTKYTATSVRTVYDYFARKLGVHKIDVITHDETVLAIFDGTAYQMLASTF